MSRAKNVCSALLRRTLVRFILYSTIIQRGSLKFWSLCSQTLYRICYCCFYGL